MRVDAETGTISLVRRPHHWDDGSERDAIGVLMGMKFTDAEIPFAAVASIRVQAGTPQATHGDMPVLFVHVTEVDGDLDDFLRRFAVEHQGADIEAINS
jgi:hypothetical protein